MEARQGQVGGTGNRHGPGDSGRKRTGRLPYLPCLPTCHHPTHPTCRYFFPATCLLPSYSSLSQRMAWFWGWVCFDTSVSFCILPHHHTFALWSLPTPPSLHAGIMEKKEDMTGRLATQLMPCHACMLPGRRRSLHALPAACLCLCRLGCLTLTSLLPCHLTSCLSIQWGCDCLIPVGTVLLHLPVYSGFHSFPTSPHLPRTGPSRKGQLCGWISSAARIFAGTRITISSPSQRLPLLIPSYAVLAAAFSGNCRLPCYTPFSRMHNHYLATTARCNLPHGLAVNGVVLPRFYARFPSGRAPARVRAARAYTCCRRAISTTDGFHGSS